MKEGQERNVLRKYLLGELPEPQRSELADRYFVNENLFDELLEIENELLDQYACGQMPPEETKKFLEYLTYLPDGRVKLATAYTLNNAQIRSTSPATVTHEDQASAVPVLPSQWKIFPAGLFGRNHLPQYVVVVILIALLCGIAYLIIAQRALRREVEQLRAEKTQAEQGRSDATQQARTAQDKETALRDRNLQLEQELTQLQKEIDQQSDNRDGSLLAVHVFSPALRSTTEPDSITISGSTKTVLLVMPIPQDEQVNEYTATLRTTRGESIWSKDRLKPIDSQQGKTVSLRLPAAQLPSSTLKLTLLGKSANGIEIAHDFYFNIRKRPVN